MPSAEQDQVRQFQSQVGEKVYKALEAEGQETRIKMGRHKILNEVGEVVQFVPRKEQIDILNINHPRIVVAKPRQVGFSAIFQKIGEDSCMYNPNTSFMTIAHTQEDAIAIRNKKIAASHRALAPELKAYIGGPYKFNNGSEITVGTDARSDVIQILHISEFGEICRTSKIREDAIINGSFPAVHGRIFVESTARGSSGGFYDMCHQALDQKAFADNRGIALHESQFYLYFMAWWQYEANRAYGEIQIEPELNDYFLHLQKSNGIYLDEAQRKWYASVWNNVNRRKKIKQEYPSTFEECWEDTLEGVVFDQEIRDVREQYRIVDNLPIDKTEPFIVTFDLGYRDQTSLWFLQYNQAHSYFHVIKYYEENERLVSRYVQVLKEFEAEHGVRIGVCLMPPDAKTNSMLAEHDNLSSVKKVIENAGWNVQIVPAPDKQWMIDGTRAMFPSLKFDRKGCELGIRRLDNYTEEAKHKHTIETHAADSFQHIRVLRTEDWRKWVGKKSNVIDYSQFLSSDARRRSYARAG